ncbi:glycoside hydrolase family 3 C-terminal domain-containing protein [Streptomyces sp. NPDC050315]|uniref:glycoside hydrolase family 3 C-terminal domain-containing protein n=1 Tax=Streptomyces sp. NPDC050315 TaxID=3155039 RepID=UPI003440206E
MPLQTPDNEAELRERLATLTLKQKVRLLTGADFWSLHTEPAAGLQRMVLSDGPAGVRGELWDERDTSANIPSSTALAATWDEARLERIGALLAAEARSKGVHVLLAPGVNLHRTPAGGRNFEYFSEDPLLTGRIGAALVRGIQSGGVAATVKHFVANESETDRFNVNAHVDERALRELYLAPFEAIVREAGPWAVMSAYNSLNGTTMTESPLQREVLKREWGFDGVIMTDWGAARSTEATANAGLDLVMPGPNGPWGQALAQAVREGRVTEETVNDKTLRLLRLAARVGVLDGIAPAAPQQQGWTAAETSAELRATAAAGFVLAQNRDALLPLQSDCLTRVAVLGPNAAAGRTLGGGSATVYPPYVISPLDGLRTALGDTVEITHTPGVHTLTRIAQAVPELTRVPNSDKDGVELRFLAADGTELGREQRRSGHFIWLGERMSGLSHAEVAAIEVHALLRAATTGDYLVGAAGKGRFKLTIDGRVAFDEHIVLPPGTDPVEAMSTPPQKAIPVPLSAGQEVRLVLRHDLRSSASASYTSSQSSSLHFLLQPPAPPEDEELERAVALARDADVAVVVVGTTAEVESEGFDRESLALPGRQDELVRRVAAANPRTVVVVNSGAPVLLPWAEEVAAVLLTWFPGQEYGRALADVLLGSAEPGGRLPVTWPASAGHLPATTPVGGQLHYDEGLFIGHRAYERDGRTPLYPFGHGLGYTTWDYLKADVDQDAAEVSVRLRNSGTRTGREVVQVYAAAPLGTLPRPVRRLVGFASVEAGPGEEVTARVTVPAHAFRYWDTVRHTWAVSPGAYRLEIGASCTAEALTAEITVPVPAER